MTRPVDDVLEYYARYPEEERLHGNPWRELELARTQDVLERHPTAPPAVAVEGPAGLLQDLPATSADADRRSRVLELLRGIDAEPSILGASAHLLALGVG